jgi:hypothetical protein
MAWAWAFSPFALSADQAGSDAQNMLAPVPLPAYTLVPGIEKLSRVQTRMLNDCLSSLSGRVPGVMVVGARTTDTHEVLDLETTNGPLMVMERRRRTESRAA